MPDGKPPLVSAGPVGFTLSFRDVPRSMWLTAANAAKAALEQRQPMKPF